MTEKSSYCYYNCNLNLNDEVPIIGAKKLSYSKKG